MKVPEVTVEEYKDWHRRYELKCKLPPDDKLREGLDYANKRAQADEDRREANRNRVAKPNSELPNIEKLCQSERTVLAPEKSDVGCSQASSGDIVIGGEGEK